MNSTANLEAQVADRVAALMSTTLTEADVHRFLLDAAGILGTESFAAYGPDLRFRWRVGERVVEIEPDYNSRTGEFGSSWVLWRVGYAVAGAAAAVVWFRW